jgi:hypothetical protein
MFLHVSMYLKPTSPLLYTFDMVINSETVRQFLVELLYKCAMYQDAEHLNTTILQRPVYILTTGLLYTISTVHKSDEFGFNVVLLWFRSLMIPCVSKHLGIFSVM